MIETSPTWFDWIFFLVPSAISISLLIQGFVNIKTGKATKFGLGDYP